ncbi:MAG: EAL domain-containing protein [Chloroflexota bacterium]
MYTVTDLQGIITFASPRTLELHGYDHPDELVGRSSFDLIAQEDHQRAAQNMQRTLEDECLRSVEYTFLKKGGKRFTAELNATLIRDSKGQPQSFIATTRDITDRKQAEQSLQENEKKYRTFVEKSLQGLAVIDENFSIVYSNPAFSEISGYSLQDLQNLSSEQVMNLIHPDDQRMVWQNFRDRLSGKLIPSRYQYRAIRKDGKIIWLDMFATRIEYMGRPAIQAVFIDITDRRLAEQVKERRVHRQEMLLEAARHLTESLETEKVLFRIASDAKEILEAYGVAIYFLESDGKTLKPAVSVEPLYEEEVLSTSIDIDNSFTGLAIKEKKTMVFNDPEDYVHGFQIPGTPVEENECVITIPLMIDDKIIGGMCINRLGVTFSAEDVALAETYAAYASTALKNTQIVDELQHEIQERKRIEKQLQHDAFHDPLTNLSNRALLIDRLGRSIERAKRHEDYLFAVLFMDLDRFKVVNDSWGHAMGDQLLIALARRLESNMRSMDTLARLGGDEFVILIEDIESSQDAILVAERIRSEIKRPFHVNGHEVFTTASIGVVLSHTGYHNPEDALRDADIAMYRAKERGKDCYEVFDTLMRKRAIERLNLETEIRQGISNKEFVNYYQPIVQMDDGQIIGFETLLRWHHPKKGIIPPSDFLYVAEETGLIIPIGRTVIYEACSQMVKWQNQYPKDQPLTISVNLSAKQFTHPDLIKDLQHILAKTKLNPNSLKLEITEGVIMEDVDLSTTILSKLRELGSQIEMDDFGTGYSSLVKLHQFPIDALKVDRAFVLQMSEGDEKLVIVRTIVSLANALGMNAVAEGVETSEQLSLLCRLGCKFGQGFYFSKPVDSKKAEKLITGSL